MKTEEEIQSAKKRIEFLLSEPVDNITYNTERLMIILDTLNYVLDDFPSKSII